MIYRQTFTVEGSGEFPFDMLRYDHCWPENEGVAAVMSGPAWRLRDASDGPGGSDWVRTPRRVALARDVHAKGANPTFGRWQSFGWVVVDGSVETRRI